MEFFKERLPEVNRVCCNCGIYVAYTNMVTRADEEFKCALCVLIEKGFLLFGVQDGKQQYFLPVGKN